MSDGQQAAPADTHAPETQAPAGKQPANTATTPAFTTDAAPVAAADKPAQAGDKAPCCAGAGAADKKCPVSSDLTNLYWGLGIAAVGITIVGVLKWKKVF